MIKEIRKRTGISQYKLAVYLGVSRSLVKLAEQGERKLPDEASNKLSFLYLQLIQNEQESKISKQKGDVPDEEYLEKKAKYHHDKMLDHQLEAELLKRKLAKMKDEYAKTTSRIALLDNAGTTDSKQVKKNARDEMWFRVLLSGAKSALKKAGPEEQLEVELEIEMQAGYAEVHKKIVKDLEKTKMK